MLFLIKSDNEDNEKIVDCVLMAIIEGKRLQKDWASDEG
jgi:hypothetical protein